VSEAQDGLDEARTRHRARSPGRRTAVVAGGWAAVVVGVLFVVPFPEVGLPLLLVGLRLLALRYDWAARAYLPIARLWARVKALSRTAKVGLAVAAVAIVAAVVWSLY
jgi:hypothetical protein